MKRKRSKATQKGGAKPRAASRTIDERSAGVIVFRQDLFGGREYLLLDYGAHWDFPKGHVEPGEDDRAAAARELREETGIREFTLIESFSRQIRYYFRARGMLIRKTVVFFLARTEAQKVKLSREHEGFAWLAYPQALGRTTYQTAKDVLRHAEAFFANA